MWHRSWMRVLGFGLILGLVGLGGATQTTGPTPPATSQDTGPADLSAKQKELMDLMRRYVEVVEKANRATTVQEKSAYMDEAQKIRQQMAQVYQEIQRLHRAQSEKAASTASPASDLQAQADKLLAQIRELEARIQRMVEDINARIAKAEKESDPVLQERAKKQIQRMIDELNELKKRHQELAEQYRRRTEKAAQAAPPPPKEEKAKPPR
jgi:chromosome segregation ATPase